MERSRDDGAPAEAQPIRYGGSFQPPERPIVPIAGDEDPVVAAVRTVLDAVATHTGRGIEWLPVELGDPTTEVPSPEVVRAVRRYRLGLVGPVAATDAGATRLRRALDLSTAVSSHPTGVGRPSSVRTGDVSPVLFRDLSGVETALGSADAVALGAALRDTDETVAGNGGRPTSRADAERLVDRAMDYAFEHDRSTVTIAHGGDRRSDGAGSFREWAWAHLERDYADGIVREATSQEGGVLPEDELVVLERRTDRLCRELLESPADHDVVVAPAAEGTTLVAVAGLAAGHGDGRGALWLGPGRLLLASAGGTENPLSVLDAAGLLLEYVGWIDAAEATRDAVSEALALGVVPRDLAGDRARGRAVDAAGFAAAVVRRLGAEGAGGVRSTVAERAAIRAAIATVHNAVFADVIDPAAIELNQLRGADEEADISLPEVGVNFAYWRRWSAERRLEVLLHELAHVEEGSGEPDHGDAFYERFVALCESALDRRDDLAPAVGDAVDPGRVRRLVVESVHEETIEPDDDVPSRKDWLRDRFGLDAAGHY